MRSFAQYCSILHLRACNTQGYQSELRPQPKEDRIEQQRHEGHKGAELDILQNRVTVLEKAAFSFAVCPVKQL
mgnify:CR=1 FL=1